MIQRRFGGFAYPESFLDGKQENTGKRINETKRAKGRVNGIINILLYLFDTNLADVYSISNQVNFLFRSIFFFGRKSFRQHSGL